MNKIDWKRKLSSRKLWAAVAGIVTGLAMVFGLDENTISTVAGAVVSVASVVAYIMAEGKVDAESVKNAVEGVQDAIEKVNGTSVTVMKSTTVFDAEHVAVEVEDQNDQN